MILVWDEWNEEHIAEHSVDRSEAAQVVKAARRPFPKKIGKGRYLVRGQASNGRYLQVVYVLREADTIDVASLALEERVAVEAGEMIGYIIHARDLEQGEKRTLRGDR